MDKAQVWPCAGLCISCGLDGGRLGNSRLVKRQSCDNATPWANAQGQVQWNYGYGRVFQITGLKKCKTADLVWESKRRFGLVVRLKAIKTTMRVSYLFIFQRWSWSRDPEPSDSDSNLTSDLTSLSLTSCHYWWLVIFCFSLCPSQSFGVVGSARQCNLLWESYKRSKTWLLLWQSDIQPIRFH